jgi:hypothetical protein
MRITISLVAFTLLLSGCAGSTGLSWKSLNPFGGDDQPQTAPAAAQSAAQTPVSAPASTPIGPGALERTRQICIARSTIENAEMYCGCVIDRIRTEFTEADFVAATDPAMPQNQQLSDFQSRCIAQARL